MKLRNVQWWHPYVISEWRSDISSPRPLLQSYTVPSAALVRNCGVTKWHSQPSPVIVEWRSVIRSTVPSHCGVTQRHPHVLARYGRVTQYHPQNCRLYCRLTQCHPQPLLSCCCVIVRQRYPAVLGGSGMLKIWYYHAPRILFKPPLLNLRQGTTQRMTWLARKQQHILLMHKCNICLVTLKFETYCLMLM